MEVLLINSLIASERRQEVQEERRRNGRTEPYVNYLAAPETHGAEGELMQPLALRRRAEFRLRRRGRPAHRHGGKRPVEEPAAVIQPGARIGRP